jgi:hypothetical protein
MMMTKTFWPNLGRVTRRREPVVTLGSFRWLFLSFVFFAGRMGLDGYRHPICRWKGEAGRGEARWRNEWGCKQSEIMDQKARLWPTVTGTCTGTAYGHTHTHNPRPDRLATSLCSRSIN